MCSRFVTSDVFRFLQWKPDFPVYKLLFYIRAVAKWKKSTEHIRRSRKLEEVHSYGGRSDWLRKSVRDIPPRAHS